MERRIGPILNYWETFRKFLTRTAKREIMPVETVQAGGQIRHPCPWEIELHRMEENGKSIEERLTFMVDQMFKPRISAEENSRLNQKFREIFKNLEDESLIMRAKAGDPNAIMELIIQAAEQYKGNQSIQRALASYYLKLGMRPLKEKLLTLEFFAREISVNPYSEQDDELKKDEDSRS